MGMRFISADMVLLAAGHNPALVSPEWLKERGLVEEEPNQFVHTSQFSLFDSDTISLLIDNQRLHVTSKRGDVAALERLATIGVEYVHLLPHLPYRAIGLNFRWVVESTVDEPIPSISTKVEESGDLAAVFPEHEIRCGALLHARKDPYVLKLTIEPQDNDALVYSFNYHHDVSGFGIDELGNCIETLPSLSKQSRQAVRRTTGLEG